MNERRSIEPNRLAINLTAIVWMTVILLVASACSTNSTEAPSPPSPTPSASQATSGGVIANGILLPARQVRLSFGASGILQEIDVGIGDMVSSGQVLGGLYELKARLEVEVAQATLEEAKAKYDLVVKDLASGRESAALALMEAQVLLNGIYNNAGMARAAALTEIVSASKDVEAAQFRLYYFRVSPSLAELEPLEALAFTGEKLAEARTDYIPYKYVSQNSEARQDLKGALDRAQGDYNSAVRILEIQAELAQAQTRLEKSRADYRNLQSGPDPDEFALARARVSEAQARLDVFDDKSASTQLTLAQAIVDAAQSRLEMAQAELEMLVLVSPMDGVVSSIEFDMGEWVTTGAPVIELLETSGWLVETKNVGELQIGRVEVGQYASIQVNAFQGETLSGHVVSIAPDAVVQQGDITYTLMIKLESTDINLRPGMTARVEIMIEE